MWPALLERAVRGAVCEAIAKDLAVAPGVGGARVCRLAAQHGGGGRATGLAAHRERGEDALGGERVEGDGGVAGRQPGVVAEDLEAGRGGIGASRRPGRLVAAVANDRRDVSGRWRRRPPSGWESVEAPGKEIGVGHERDDTAPAGVRAGVPPALPRRLDRRGRVAIAAAGKRPDDGDAAVEPTAAGAGGAGEAGGASARVDPEPDAHAKRPLPGA